MTGKTPLRIGLTGGIATGKSTVADYLARTYQIPILDADVYAREVVTPGSSILAAIAHRYGPGILQADGGLNRHSLGEIVFRQPLERRWLEEQIHPMVRDRLETELQKVINTWVVLAIPLLFEAEMLDLVDRVWVVYATPEQQLARLLKRDTCLNAIQAQNRLKSQMDLNQKMAQADWVFNNTSTLDFLWMQVDRAVRDLPDIR
ncbi:MAG: dephospho-CoA kinase [Jaaginema sp. PMC 1079.18]|nr:dephospho-CoA kinase [Jaaginema sp. PMC 1080.18]MEC4852960.1 dephospho-CoA kinase [Jaaginema sp. PMC 1079.18]MEC4867410.1 dephospho-CoA kinase [Jaaginema sp. PMC 1078.18]